MEVTHCGEAGVISLHSRPPRPRYFCERKNDAPIVRNNPERKHTMRNIDKHRPTTFADVIGNQKAITRIYRAVDDNDGFGGLVLMLTGQTGNGKTLLADIMAAEVDGALYRPDCTRDGETAILIDQIKQDVMQDTMFAHQTIYIFDEADKLHRLTLCGQGRNTGVAEIELDNIHCEQPKTLMIDAKEPSEYRKGCCQKGKARTYWKNTSKKFRDYHAESTHQTECAEKQWKMQIDMKIGERWETRHVLVSRRAMKRRQETLCRHRKIAFARQNCSLDTRQSRYALKE